jgi:hypothetical protein
LLTNALSNRINIIRSFLAVFGINKIEWGNAGKDKRYKIQTNKKSELILLLRNDNIQIYPKRKKKTKKKSKTKTKQM